MMGVRKQPEQQDGKLLPAESHGVKLISIGIFCAGGDPIDMAGANDSHGHSTVFP